MVETVPIIFAHENIGFKLNPILQTQKSRTLARAAVISTLQFLVLLVFSQSNNLTS